MQRDINFWKNVVPYGINNDIIEFVEKYKNNKNYEIGFWVCNVQNSYGNTYKFKNLDLSDRKKVESFVEENCQPLTGNFYRRCVEITNKGKIVDKLEKSKNEFSVVYDFNQ